jgi:predicted dehydrogenase
VDVASEAASPVAIAVAGIGGFAHSIASLIESEGGACTPPARLVAVCDPDLDAHAARVAELKAKGVAVFDTFEAMLAHREVEAVWLPLPIQLHRPFTERALAAGKPVMVEKPAAGSIEEVDAMIAARDRAGLGVAVGFQDVYDVTTLPLKRRLAAGEFGRITRATVHASWPRSDRYFARSGWAGRQRVGDSWVLDSPANNALSHYVHITQFLLGPTLHETSRIERIEAELYRAADIENYDTISVRAHLAGGTELLVLLTHAGGTAIQPMIRMHGEGATIERTASRVTIRDASGEHVQERGGLMRRRMLQRFARLVRGLPGEDTALATLEMARQHTVLINAVSEAAPIITVPAEAISNVSMSDGGTVRAIAGIESALARCAEAGQLLHESGAYDWTRSPVVKEVGDYRRFAGPASPDAAHASQSAADD